MAREIDPTGAPEDDDYIDDWEPGHTVCGGHGDPGCSGCWMHDYDEGDSFESMDSLEFHRLVSEQIESNVRLLVLASGVTLPEYQADVDGIIAALATGAVTVALQHGLVTPIPIDSTKEGHRGSEAPRR
ncbi:hypothetical protein [Plantibacter flavus]|nr:hypothetical protein [Plantibacter flavus]